MSTISRLTTLSAAGAGGGADTYWITKVTPTSGSVAFTYRGPAVDSNKNMVAFTKLEDGTYDDVYVVQLDPDGDVSWSKRLEHGNTYGQTVIVNTPSQIAIDGSDNIYLAYEHTGGDLASYVTDWAVAKLTSSGAYVDSSQLQGTTYERARGIHFDGTNLIAYGNDDSNYSMIVKYNTSLSNSAQKYFSANQSYYITDLTSDSSNNYYAAVRSQASSGSTAYMGMMKLNSSFTPQWYKEFGYDAYSITNVVEVSGNSYYTGYAGGSGAAYTMLFHKLSSSGGWEYDYYTGDTDTGALYFARGMTKLSDGSIVLGAARRPSGSSKYEIFIGKIDVSGNNPSYDWQHYISHSSNNIGVMGLTVDADDNIYGVGYETMFKIPVDGLTTGTYGSYTVSNASLTFQPTYQYGTSRSVTTGNRSWSEQSPTFSTANLGYSESKQDF